MCYCLSSVNHHFSLCSFALMQKNQKIKIVVRFHPQALAGSHDNQATAHSNEQLTMNNEQCLFYYIIFPLTINH